MKRAAVALESMPDTQELLAAKAAGLSLVQWRDAGKRATHPGLLAAVRRDRRLRAADGVRPWHPYRSKWEWDYATHYLPVEMAYGSIREWAYETERLEIGAGAFYTPDFPVTVFDGMREMREVKGYRREAAMVRIRVAAKLYPQFRFVLVTKVNGQWNHTTIGDPK